MRNFARSLALLPLLSACGGESNQEMPTGDAGRDSATSMPDGGGREDAATLDDAANPSPDGGEPSQYGLVLVTQAYGATGTSASARAAFGYPFDPLDPATQPACTIVATEGDCLLRTCEEATAEYRNAGTVSVDLGEGVVVPLERTSGGTYSSSDTLFEAGQRVTVRSMAEGDTTPEVPPFTLTATAPPMIEYSVDGDRIVRSEGHAVVAPEGMETVAITIDAGAKSIACRSHNATAPITIAASLLEQLDAGSAAYAEAAYDFETTTVPGFSITLGVGQGNSRQITLE